MDAEIKAQTPEDSELNNSPLQTPFAAEYYKNAPWYSYPYPPPPPVEYCKKNPLYTPPPPLQWNTTTTKKIYPPPPPLLEYCTHKNLLYPPCSGVLQTSTLPPPPQHTHPFAAEYCKKKSFITPLPLQWSTANILHHTPPPAVEYCKYTPSYPTPCSGVLQIYSLITHPLQWSTTNILPHNPPQ